MGRITRNLGKPWVILTAFLSFLPARGETATIPVNCDAGEKIQAKLTFAKPGDTLLVSGTCNENVRIPAEVVRITLDGQGKATIHGPVATAHVVLNRGKEITIKGFTITGGKDGIHLSRAAAGASAIIDGNTIQNTGDSGIHLDQTSVARIGNNKIQNNADVGINVWTNSSARIGSITGRDPTLGPNTIQNNGGHGIAVSHNSGVNLSGPGRAREGPNQTDPALKNGGLGIKCSIGGYVDGPLGTLAGARGIKEFDKGCLDGLMP